MACGVEMYKIYSFYQFSFVNNVNVHNSNNSESADLRHRSSIPGLSKPNIRTFKTYHCFSPPLFHIFADGDPDHSQFIFHGSTQ